MNSEKLGQLFRAARDETPSTPAEDFDLRVLQQIRRNPAREELSVFDQLTAWFPRIALAAAAMIALCVASEFIFSREVPSLADSASQLSEQWVFAEN
jgi:hypothetical protein